MRKRGQRRQRLGFAVRAAICKPFSFNADGIVARDSPRVASRRQRETDYRRLHAINQQARGHRAIDPWWRL